MQCVQPVRVKKSDSTLKGANFNLKYPDGLLVPCGKCIGCRIKKRSEWSMRMLHELSYWDSSIFITLTYDDDNIPEFGSLKKKHLQDFFKRLRSYLHEEAEDKPIKYFACGEYGDKTSRPHYHAIVFGLSLSEHDRSCVKRSWSYCDWSVDVIEKRAFGIAESDSIRYVAQYIDKKLDGEDNYGWREPVFRLLSNGIGKRYVLDNAKQFIDNAKLTVKGVKYSFPRYYLSKMEVNEEWMNKIKSISQIKDCEANESIIGINILTDDAYKCLSVRENVMIDERKRDSNQQLSKNMYAKINLKKFKL